MSFAINHAADFGHACLKDKVLLTFASRHANVMYKPKLLRAREHKQGNYVKDDVHTGKTKFIVGPGSVPSEIIACLQETV